jgi:LPS export ABC transporter protein LptC
VLLTLACGEPPPKTEPAATDLPAATFKNLVLRETRDGKLEWVLRAREAWRESPNTPTRLAHLRVDFYQQTDRVRSVLTADSGRVDGQRGTLVATGHVVVATPEGNQLLTEELFWDRKNGQVASDVAVRFVRGRDVLTGVGFRSDPNLQRYEILRDVEASLGAPSEIRHDLFEPDSSDTSR